MNPDGSNKTLININLSGIGLPTADIMVGKTSMPRQASVSGNRRPGLAGDVPSVAAETA